MLWWLLLLLIPILVHLFNFRKHKKVVFSNIQFLKKIKVQTQQTKTLKKYLLLSSRLGLISCLVLAFSLPYCGNEQSQERVTNHYFYFLDNSPSMEIEMEQMKNCIRGSLENFKDGDKVSFAIPKGDASTFLTQEDALDFVNKLNLGSWTARYSDFKAIHNSVIQESGGITRSFILSDFSKGFFDISKDSLEDLNFVKIGGTAKENLTIDTAFAENAIWGTTQTTKLNIKISNHGDAAQTVSINLFSKEQNKGSVQLSCEANNSAIAEMQVAALDLQEAYLQIDDNGLSFDNKLYLNFSPSKEKVKILLAGKPCKYISSVFATDPIYELKSLSKLPDALSGFDLIIVNGKTGNVKNNLALKSFAEEGGNLLLIPGEGNSQENFSFLGASQWSVVKEGEFSISKIDFAHPLYQNVYSKIPKNPVEPKLKRFFQIALQGRSSAILKTNNNQIILTQTSLGQGQVFQFALPISTSWSDLPLVGYLFYPTISNMALGNKASTPLFGWLSSSYEPVKIPNVKQKGVEQYEIGLKNRFYTTELIKRLGKSYIITGREVDIAGNYGLYESVSQKVKLLNLALNVPRDDSDNERLETGVLKDITANFNATFIQGDENSLKLSNLENEQFGQLWKWFILFGLIFIVIEIFLLRFL